MSAASFDPNVTLISLGVGIVVMSGQYPPPSASSPPPSHPFSRPHAPPHHLPPAPNTASGLGQYGPPQGPPQHMRGPILRSPPPPQTHITPWSHSTQNAGLNPVGSGLSFYGSPHLPGLGVPGRAQQPWQPTSQAHSKPSEVHHSHPSGANPLFGIHSLLDVSTAASVGSEVQTSASYQQEESMDLSSHSVAANSAANSEDSVSPLNSSVIPENREVLRNGTVLPTENPTVNGDIGEKNAPALNKQESNAVENKEAVVSVIAQNPLRDNNSEVLNCSKPVEKIDKVECLVVKSPERQSEKIVTPVPVTRIPDNWQNTNHTAENVESILENMFNAQDDKPSEPPQPAPISLVIPQSVIVTNESRPSVVEEARPLICGSSAVVDEKIENLEETLEASSPDVIPTSEEKIEDLKMSLEDKQEEEKNKPEIKLEKEQQDTPVDEKVKIVENILEELEEKEIKNEVEEMQVEQLAVDVPVEPKESQPEESKFNPGLIDLAVPNTPNVLRLMRKPLTENEKPPIATAATTPVETVNLESEKNPFIEVESELEKMFAGIVEPTSEAMSENKLETSTVPIDSKKLPQATTKRPAKKRKVSNSRRPVDVFGSGGSSSTVDSTPKKKTTKRVSDGDKKTKKMKFDSGRDSPIGRKVGKGFQKDTSNDSVFPGRSRGPFVHIEGSKDNPTSVVIVNSGVRPEDDETNEKTAARRKHSTYHRSEGRPARPQGSGLYSSTLSSRYDSHTPDTTWICVFCKRGPHCEGGLGGEPAGDLFGPYKILPSGGTDTVLSGTPSDKDVAEEQKRRGAGKQQSLRASGGIDNFVQKISKKSKKAAAEDTEAALKGMILIPNDKNSREEPGYEVWIHEQCASWAPGVYIVGSKLIGLEEAVWAASRTKCSHCGEAGAGIGCVTRGCPTRLHYGCALLSNWHLDEDTFIAKCSHHRGTSECLFQEDSVSEFSLKL